MPARTVKLQETDSTFFASPSALWMGSHDSVFIADRFHKRVFRVSADGAILAALGRPGAGPGELELPLEFVGLGDSAIGVVDEAKKAIEVFSLATGKFERARRYDGSIMSVAIDGGIVWMGGVSPRHSRGVKRWDLQTDSMSYLVPLPGSYQRNGPLAGFFYMVAVAPKEDKLIVGYSADRAILVTTRDGEPVDSFAIPSSKRRGEPRDLESRVDPKADMEFADMAALSSVLLKIGVRADGSLAVVHMDFGFVPPRKVTARVFVSIVSADLKTACVDAELPQEDPTAIPLSFRGDTLFAVQQHVDSNSTRAETSLVGYVVDTSMCEWLPVAHTNLH